MNEEVASSSSSLSTKKPPRPSPTGFSYVEDGEYTNLEEEIEAMGGDPSFLMEVPSLSPTTTTITTSTSNSTSTDPMSSDASPVPTPTVAWEWDGVEEEDAYFDE